MLPDDFVSDDFVKAKKMANKAETPLSRAAQMLKARYATGGAAQLAQCHRREKQQVNIGIAA